MVAGKSLNPRGMNPEGESHAEQIGIQFVMRCWLLGMMKLKSEVSKYRIMYPVPSESQGNRGT
jgi:hypothetical protein